MALCFFSAREYLVSPVLLSTGATRRHAQRLEDFINARSGKVSAEDSAANLSLSDIRHDRVLDTTLTAILAYGTYAGFTRGRGAIVRAGLTAGFGAGILQYAVNFARVSRIKALSKQGGSAQHQPQPSMRLRETLENPTQTPDMKYEDTFQGKIFKVMSYLLPLDKMTKAEYLEKLLGERDVVDRKLAALEAEENRIYDWIQRQKAARGESLKPAKI